jgi:hypothetical protein
MSEHETAWPELACVSDGGAATCGRRQEGRARHRHRAGISRTHPGAVDNVATVQDNAARYTKREMAATNEARDLMTRFKGVPSADIIKMMRDGTGHLRAATGYHQGRGRLGTAIADFKGRSTAAKAGDPSRAATRGARTPGVPHRPPLRLGTALRAHAHAAHALLFVAPTKSKSAPDLLRVIVKQMRSARARGIQITMLRCDRESAVVAIEGRPQRRGVTLNTTAEGGAVPAVERCVRQIKERLRGVINTPPST